MHSPQLRSLMRSTEESVVGPLRDLPILLKNHITTVDEMGNAAFSNILAGGRVPRDSTIAAKLGQAGGIVWTQPTCRSGPIFEDPIGAMDGHRSAGKLKGHIIPGKTRRVHLQAVGW